MSLHSCSGSVARELLLALPDCETDLYRIHQIVWRHVVRAVNGADMQRKNGMQPPEFIYRIDGGMIRVRSCDLPQAKTMVSSFRPDAPVHVDLAAVWGSDHQNPVPDAHVTDWCAEKIASAGFAVSGLVVKEYEYRAGIKQLSDRQQNIRIPVASVSATLKAVDTASCLSAWRQGVGRGKRFGLGMLAH